MSHPFPFAIDAAAAEAAARTHAQTALQALAGTLRLARVLAERQRRIDLHGLDARVGVVCAGVLDLAPDQARLLRPALIDLRAELDALAATMAPPP